MKIKLLLFLLSCFNATLFSQVLQWQQLIGGTNDDRVCCLSETDDGAMVFMAYTRSSDVDIPTNNGDYDVAICKMRADGKVIWLNTEGGEGNDAVLGMAKTTDGGFVGVGESNSADGDYASNHGAQDALVLKFDANGSLLWKKLLGGSTRDRFSDVIATNDGGFVAIGGTYSIDGDLDGLINQSTNTENGWWVKFDSNGNVEWSHALEGDAWFNFGKLKNTVDGGYLIAGTRGVRLSPIPNQYGGRDPLKKHDRVDAWFASMAIKLFSGFVDKGKVEFLLQNFVEIILRNMVGQTKIEE